MSRRSVWLTPLDTLFFRDSQPFEAGGMQVGVVSLFPPPARTLIGALRLALARGQGYRGSEAWSERIADVPGNGPNDMGKLRFSGPLLTLGNELLYPLPLHLVGRRDHVDAEHADIFVPETLLAPGIDVLCDLGPTRLPVPVHREAAVQTGAGFFLRQEAFEAVLAGHVPDAAAVISSERLYAPEARVGLQRDERLRTAKDGYLYSTTHLRLRKDVRLVLEIDGLPDAWALTCPGLVALGGESRMAELDTGNALPLIEAPTEAITGSQRLTVTLLTPLYLQRETMPRPGEELAGIPGARVVSACLGKPVLFGGWDSLRREPLPLRPYLPAGSTWFCAMDTTQQAKAACARHGSCLGEEAALGLGRIALGTWTDTLE